MTPRIPRAEMQRAVYRRDASYDGAFFVAVRTTSVFCRPSCPARKPLEANMVFYPTAREALFAGFRPCKRCRPLETDGRQPEWAARLLALVEKGYHGIVVAGTGLGHVNKPLYPAIKRAVEAGVHVGMAVQTLWGYAQMYVYDTGRDLLDPCSLAPGRGNLGC